MLAIEEQVSALRTRAGFVVRPEVYTLVLEGPDRVRFLNGMLTSDVALLAPGQGQLSVKATPRGRVEGLVRVRCLEEALEIDLEEASAQNVANSLVKMIIMDEVTLGDRTPDRTVIGLYGPTATEVLASAGITLSPLALHGFIDVDGPLPGRIIRDPSFGVPGYELHVPPAQLDAWQTALTEARAAVVSPAALDIVRVERGRPRDGIDIDADTIPMEARLEEALDFKKGCYVGQEVIARAHNLGGVKHILVALDFEGETPAVGSRLVADADGKMTGEVTSAVRSPTAGRSIGLGYVRVAHQAPATSLSVHPPGDDAPQAPIGRATVRGEPI